MVVESEKGPKHDRDEALTAEQEASGGSKYLGPQMIFRRDLRRSNQSNTEGTGSGEMEVSDMGLDEQRVAQSDVENGRGLTPDSPSPLLILDSPSSSSHLLWIVGFGLLKLSSILHRRLFSRGVSELVLMLFQTEGYE
ncbi:hypothetical protein K1719_020988 [Acacia pycnantha]|nr:hypothetical protein K1719_020988 [Acacia pycnantha]